MSPLLTQVIMGRLHNMLIKYFTMNVWVRVERTSTLLCVACVRHGNCLSHPRITFWPISSRSSLVPRAVSAGRLSLLMLVLLRKREFLKCPNEINLFKMNPKKFSWQVSSPWSANTGGSSELRLIGFMFAQNQHIEFSQTIYSLWYFKTDVINQEN